MARKPRSFKQRKFSKKKLAAAALGAAVAVAAFWTLKSGNHKVVLPTYQAVEVVDGDTFETKEDRVVRLDMLDAPDLDNCGGQEAKKELEKLVRGKPLYIKVRYVDNYKRLVSNVYTINGLVNEQLVKSGWARAYLREDPEKTKIEAASKYARDNHLGIYSPMCLSLEPDKAGCVIKGNVRPSYKTKLYTLPGCESYNITIVQKDQGDQWFCTEAEAKKAGFSLAGNCPLDAKVK